MSKVRSIFMRSDNAGDPKTTSRVSPATELVVDGNTEAPRVISSPSLAKQPTLPTQPTSTYGRLTIRIIEGSDLPLAKLDPAHGTTSSTATSGWVRALRRSSLTGRKSTLDTKMTSTAAAMCVVVHLTGEPQHMYSTECILASQDSWNEEFMVDTVCSDEVLTLYGIDRMQNPPYFDLFVDMAHHPCCIGKVTIPLSRLPDNQEIEQWYSFTGNTTSQTFTRAAIRVCVKFTSMAIAPSSPMHHHQRHPSFIGHPSSDPATHVDEDIDDDSATDLCLPTALIDYVLLVGPSSVLPHSSKPSSSHDVRTPGQDNIILRRYPQDDRTEFPLPTKIEWFCFPGGYEVTTSASRPISKHFTFVLSGGADGLSKCYGSCILVFEPVQESAGSLQTRWHPICLCILSRVPMLEFMQDAAIALMWQYLDNAALAETYFYELAMVVPRPVRDILDVSITLARCTWRLSLPRHAHAAPFPEYAALPSLVKSHHDDDGARTEPTSILLPPLPYSMHVFFKCFPVAVAVKAVVLALCEYRIVVHSTQLSLLCPITETIKALMYPFRWPHPYVPMLPRILSEYVQAPLPYILGVHSAWLSSLFEAGKPEHLVLVDADRGTVTLSTTTTDAGIPSLPLALTRDLHARLKRFMQEPWSPVIEHNIRLAFVTYLTTMLTGYRDCLFFVNSSFPVFNQRRFLATYVAADMIPFMTKFLVTQTFETFLETHSSSHMHAFHAIYTLVCKAQGSLWLKTRHVTDCGELYACPNKVLTVSMDQPTTAPGSLDAMARAIQLLPLTVHTSTSKDDMALPNPRVWTLEDVAATVGLDKTALENAVYRTTGGGHDGLSNTLHRQLSTEEEKVEQSMHKCLVGIFSSDDTLVDGVRQACEASFKAQYARELFVLILMQPHHRSQSSDTYIPRGSGSCLGDVGFRLLVHLASVMLEQCDIHEDFANARGLLQVSAQFYRVVEVANPKQQRFGGAREYLQQSLKSQPICRSLDMWHHAFSRDMEAAMKSDDADVVSDDLFFSHMGSLVYDMLNVDVPVGKVHTFVSAMCSTYSKGKELQDTLAQLVENLHRALVMSMEMSPGGSSLSSPRHPPGWAFATPNVGVVPTSVTAYDLDTVIRRKLSNVSDVSSSSDSAANILIAAPSPIACLAVHGEHVAAGCLNGSMHLYAHDTLTTLDGHLAPVTQVQFRGHALISTSYDATVRVWNLHAQNSTSLSPRRSKPFLRFLATDVDTCRVLRGHTAPIVALELGKQLAVDRVLLATGSWDKCIRIWDSVKETSVMHMVHSSAVTCLKFIATSSGLVSGDAGAGLDVWDVHTGRKKGHFTAHRCGIKELQIAGDRLVSASSDRSLKVWDVNFRSGQSCTHVLMGHSGPVTCVALGGPADPTICSGSADGVVKVWDLRATGKGARLELSGHGGRITTLQRDFTKVISSSEDGTLRVWNMHTGVCGQLLAGHMSGITGVGFQDPNLLSASWDGAVRVWDVNVDS